MEINLSGMAYIIEECFGTEGQEWRDGWIAKKLAEIIAGELGESMGE